MAKAKTVEQDSETKMILSFIKGAVRTVLNKIPATLIAVCVGAILGGFLGLVVLPLAPFFVIGGAVFFGLPVAIWEYLILSRDETAWDYII